MGELGEGAANFYSLPGAVELSQAWNGHGSFKMRRGFKMSAIVDVVVNNVSMLAMLEKVRNDLANQLTRTEARIQRIFIAAELLETAGFKTNLSIYSSYGISLDDIPRDQLPALRKVLGKMRVSSKQVKDSRKRLLTVHLRFDDHPDVMATYEKKMPRHKKGEPDSIRCKIVRNVRIEHVLVCEKV